MGLSVLAPAPVTALVERATVKTRLVITDSSKDALLDELIEEQSAAILTAFGRPILRQRYVETQPQTGLKRLLLSPRALDPDSLSVTIDGVAVTVADEEFSVEDAAQSILYRSSGWGSPSCTAGQDAEAVIAATFYAGRLIPRLPVTTGTERGVVTTWTAATAYALGAWVRPLAAAQASPLRFECTTAGTSHASVEPTWPTTAGGNPVSDGTAAWTARQAGELPKVVRSIAWLAVQDAYTRLGREAGLASRSQGNQSESYFATHTETELPPNVLRTIEQLRTWL